MSLHRNAEAVTLAFSLSPVYPQDVLHTPPASFVWAWKTTGTTRPFSSPLSCSQQSSLPRPFDPRVHRIKFSLYETVLTVEVQTHRRPPDAQTSPACQLSWEIQASRIWIPPLSFVIQSGGNLIKHIAASDCVPYARLRAGNCVCVISEGRHKEPTVDAARVPELASAVTLTQPESPGKEEPQWRKCLLQIGL